MRPSAPTAGRAAPSGPFGCGVPEHVASSLHPTFGGSTAAPSRAALEAAKDAREAAEEAEENAADDLELAGRDGANAIRNLSSAAKQYDRANPGERTHDTLLADGYSDFIHSDGTVVPLTLDKLVAKVKSLGDTHALAPNGAALITTATAIRTADAALKTATEARAIAEANEEIAQAALRRAYEANYLDGRKKFGREEVERLFPRIRRRKKSGPPAEPPAPPA